MADADDNDDTTATLLPLSKIKKIMRSDPDVRTVSLEAVLLVTKATVLVAAGVGKETVPVTHLGCGMQEMFIELLAQQSLEQAHSAKRKTVQHNDIGLPKGWAGGEEWFLFGLGCACGFSAAAAAKDLLRS
jgi:histone H3/H4